MKEHKKISIIIRGFALLVDTVMNIQVPVRGSGCVVLARPRQREPEREERDTRQRAQGEAERERLAVRLSVTVCASFSCHPSLSSPRPRQTQSQTAARQTGHRQDEKRTIDNGQVEKRRVSE